MSSIEEGPMIDFDPIFESLFRSKLQHENFLSPDSYM